MEESTNFSDLSRSCPDCSSIGGLTYVEIPASRRVYAIGDETFSDHFGPSRDYKCRNCDAEFTLTAWTYFE